MSEKVVKEGSANADLKADVQNDQQSDVRNDQQANVKIDSNDQQADCGKRGFRVRQRGSRQKNPFIPLKDLKPYLKLN